MVMSGANPWFSAIGFPSSKRNVPIFRFSLLHALFCYSSLLIYGLFLGFIPDVELGKEALIDATIPVGKLPNSTIAFLLMLQIIRFGK
jgi:antibiotic biosynthesis monooxygenase (ABM) superfamily enzyme